MTIAPQTRTAGSPRQPMAPMISHFVLLELDGGGWVRGAGSGGAYILAYLYNLLFC